MPKRSSGIFFPWTIGFFVGGAGWNEGSRCATSREPNASAPTSAAVRALTDTVPLACERLVEDLGRFIIGQANANARDGTLPLRIPNRSETCYYVKRIGHLPCRMLLSQIEMCICRCEPSRNAGAHSADWWEQGDVAGAVSRPSSIHRNRLHGIIISVRPELRIVERKWLSGRSGYPRERARVAVVPIRHCRCRGTDPVVRGRALTRLRRASSGLLCRWRTPLKWPSSLV